MLGGWQRVELATVTHECSAIDIPASSCAAHLVERGAAESHAAQRMLCAAAARLLIQAEVHIDTIC